MQFNNLNYFTNFSSKIMELSIRSVFEYILKRRIKYLKLFWSFQPILKRNARLK